MTIRGDPRLGDWLDVVAGLLRDPGAELPVERLALELRASFGAVVVGWSESLDPVRSRVFPVADWAGVPAGTWHRAGRRHPLLAWYGATADPRAQTTGRLPATLADTTELGGWREFTRPYGVTQELAMPLELAGARHRAFVLARGGDDFDARDLALARRLQPALAGVDRLARVLAGLPGTPPAADLLTARERAVLSLLAAGLTAEGIGHRLGISPRTVHKHLENAYGKLHVRDKVSAVRRARNAGVLPPPE